MKKNKWSNPKGRKTVSVKPHTRRLDVQDAWGRFAYVKYLNIKGYRRKKPKK